MKSMVLQLRSVSGVKQIIVRYELLQWHAYDFITGNPSKFKFQNLIRLPFLK